MNLIDSIRASAPELAAVRRDLHANPELGFQEERTADVVAARLAEWGIPVHRGLGRTGVVGIVKNGTSSRAIGLRADMDALPMTEHNSFPHRSRVPGRMHACGHDGHTAMLLAAARHLATNRNFDGTVYLIFQPAEEGGGGAREMIADGLFQRFPMDAVFGAHNWPGLHVGQIGVNPGAMAASSNEFRIVLTGKGSHAAMPYLGVDPVPLACQLVLAFQTIVTRNVRPIDPAVISVTMIHGGEATNVVPDSVCIEGTVRTFSTAVLDTIEARMRDLTAHTAAAYGATSEFVFKRNYPPTVNHPAESAFVRSALGEVVGPERVIHFEPTMGAEDFSYFLLEKPGCYFVIGNGEGGHRDAGHGLGPCMLHNPSYDFNDALIPLGATCWVKLAEAWFAQPR